MKTLKITLLLFFIAISFVEAQTGSKLENALKPLIAEVGKAETADDLKPVVNKLERISQAETTEWLQHIILPTLICICP